MARAASAPPLFFHPIVLRTSSGQSAFEDGGLSIHNNPTREAILEVAEQTHWNSVGNVVSVGTARKNVSWKPNAIGTARRLIDKLASPEEVEALVKHMSTSEHQFNYWRFNAEADSDHALTTIFDEWKPRSGVSAGRDTVGYMRRLFESWVNQETNRRALNDCAKRLVDARRARAEITPAKWERFVTCHSFTCRESQCPINVNRDEVFYHRDDFEDHLVSQHHIQRGSQRFSIEMRECRNEWKYV